MKKGFLILSLLVGVCSVFGAAFISNNTVEAAALDDFKAKCVQLGGVYKYAAIDGGRTPFHYCSINGSGISDSIGGTTEEGALNQINQYVDNPEKYECNRTAGKQWNNTTGVCEDKAASGSSIPVTTCPVTSFFGTEICDPNDPESVEGAIPKLIITILNWALIGVGTVVVIFVVIGGVIYMTAAGSAERAKQGTKIIGNAILGLVLYLVMISVLNFIIPGGVFTGT